MRHSQRHDDTNTPQTTSGSQHSWRQRIQSIMRRWRVQQSGIAFLAGLLGSLAALLVMGVLRLWWGTLTPPELVGERLLPLIPADQFVALLARFKPNPKTEPLGLALLGQVVLGVLIALPYAYFARPAQYTATPWPHRRGWLVAGAVALLMELVALGLFWPVVQAGVYGDPFDRARWLTAISLLLTFCAYASVTLLAIWWLHWRLRPVSADDAPGARLPEMPMPDTVGI